MIPAPRPGAVPSATRPAVILPTRPTVILPTRLGAILLAGAALAGCAGSSSSSTAFASGARSHASAAALAACRQRADVVYNTQNRGDIYRADNYATNDRDSPFASTGLSGITSSGLSGRYHRDQLEDDCLASSGEGAPAPGADPTAVAPAPGGAAAVAPSRGGTFGAVPPGPLPVPAR